MATWRSSTRSTSPTRKAWQCGIATMALGTCTCAPTRRKRSSSTNSASSQASSYIPIAQTLRTNARGRQASDQVRCSRCRSRLWQLPSRSSQQLFGGRRYSMLVMPHRGGRWAWQRERDIRLCSREVWLDGELLQVPCSRQAGADASAFTFSARLDACTRTRGRQACCMTESPQHDAPKACKNSTGAQTEAASCDRRHARLR
mmetsp:Transcript_98235/g.273380  ORF Transcript_98235/g.273380 Transcript_98235/m.273380 type:complete len:202 (-) Transcript_98235:61-666(-)